MMVSTLVLVILPLLHNALAQQGKFSGQADVITAPPELSTPHVAASLDIARNVSAEFPSNVVVPIHPSTYVPPTYYTNPPYTTPTNNGRNTQPTNYIPPCWTHPTTTTAKPVTHNTPRYTTRQTPTTYVPPCWTHPTTKTTVKPTTHSTTPYVPPCWTHPTSTTTAKPRYTTTPSIPPCWTHPTTTTTVKPTTHSTTPYVPPCWTHPTTTTAKPRYTTKPSIPPCWTATTTTTTPKPSTTTPYVPPCWTQTTPVVKTPQPVPSSTTPEGPHYVCEERNHYYPIPTECNTYIRCKDNVASKQICPAGQVFKPDIAWPKDPCVSSAVYKCTHGYVLDEIPKNICPGTK